jgi:alpha-N-arabinofuranosidase
MFSVNQGTRLLPVLLDGSAKNGQDELYTTAALDERTGEVIVKFVNTAPAVKELRVNLAGANIAGKVDKAFVLESADLKAENSLDNPTRIAPVERHMTISSGEFAYTLTPQSFTVLRISTR